MRQRIDIHPARPDEAAAMARILSDWVEATPWMPRLYSDAETEEYCASLVPQTRVVRDDAGRLGGFLTQCDSEVVMLYLAAEARGRGLGAALLDRAKTGRDYLALWSFAANTRARAFYGTQGFIETGGSPGDNAEGLPDIRLEWSRR